MAVEVRVPGPLESVTGGKRVVTAEGETVNAVLTTLGDSYPGLRERIIGDDGQVHRFVNIYLNDEDIRFLGGMNTAVKAGDVLAILPALAGGADDALR
jgi:MoaD family protein